MTDQSKIPLPGDGTSPAGKSLFERATEAFDISGLKPASVPKDLPPLAKRLRSRKPQADLPVEDALEGLAVGEVVAPAKTRHEGEVFFFGFFG